MTNEDRSMVPKFVKSHHKSLAFVSNIFFVTVGILLALTAFFIAGVSLWHTVSCVHRDCDLMLDLFNLVGHLIIAAAIFDVGRYLLEEEVLRDRELHSPSEARRSLTKFMVIIVIAVTLESLLGVIKASTGEASDVIYPAALFVVAVLLLVGLGIYQRFSSLAENAIDEN